VVDPSDGRGVLDVIDQAARRRLTDGLYVRQVELP
jgi:hypothetical protein